MPNVVMLMSDEHNPFYSSVWGHPGVRTPNFDRLAQTGTVFENAYCPSPLCLPSRSAVMAGRRVHALQTYNNSNLHLDPSYPSYGSVLREQGVHTAYIGKTDVYAPGDELGFSEMIMPLDRRLPGDTNQRRRPLRIRQGAEKRADGFGPRPDAGARDARGVDAAVQWLRTTAPSLDRPWVLVVNTTNPHFPHLCDPELWDLYPDWEDLPEHGIDFTSARHPYACDLRAHFQTEGFTDAQARGLRRGYLGCVTFVDRQLGKLIDALAETDQADATNVIYTADHGDMMGKFGMWWKCSLYEDSVRVPCLAAGPDFAQATRVSTPVDLLDVQASLFAATGAQRPTEWVGAPLHELAGADGDRVVFSEYHGHGTRASAYMVRQGDWKLIHYADAPHQLFDLAADPDELTNLYESKPDVVARLDAELRRICDPAVEQDRAEAFIERQLAAVTGADPVEG